MEDETCVSFGVHDYLIDASVVTQLMQLEPKRVLVAGQPKPNVPKMLSRQNSWILESPLPSSAHVEEHIEALLVLLQSHAEAITTLINVYQAEAGINCAIYYKDFNSGIHLSHNITRRVASLGLYLGFDLYFLGGKHLQKVLSP